MSLQVLGASIRIMTRGRSSKNNGSSILDPVVKSRMKMLYIKPLLQRSVSYLSSPSRLLQTRSAAQWRIASTKPFSTASKAGENGQTVSVSPTNVEVETQGYVRIVAINRPEKRNAVNRETAKELYDVFQDFGGGWRE